MVYASMMRFNLHGAKVSGNILIYQFALTVVTTTTFSRMSPDSNSDHESNGALYTELSKMQRQFG